ncbi:alpha-amylase family glycosyl hydrolase [Psychromonas ossibalaenae]|uniref:alpha-amylase family glycosyl hydrolase n=1 Tax=Psychromonas ossibalaenae TaxID=444922 RepID=UPI0003705241|nr:alpha-amylase family glycosyl hydrolase [Psychromonas ossibalaenae]
MNINNREITTEIHVKGATYLNFNIPAEFRGTYLGLCHDYMIEFFKQTGITKLQLQPVMEFQEEQHLIENGLTNYWGYNPSCWITPTMRYATQGGDPVSEFKQMVKILKDNGIKVIIDVVYNHVAESVRKYYPHWNRNYSGCGDTVQLEHCVDRVIQSMHTWYCDYGVDGFRFDLATALGRDSLGGFNPNSKMLTAIKNDPKLQGAILIAEPWDCETYQLGRFPAGFQECSDRYRQCVREFWKGTDSIGNLAKYITGSQDTFNNWQSKRPVNYVTYHDGYTLQDLVSYDKKQNFANKEDNQDGCKNEDNASWGRYKPGDTPAQTTARRERDKRSMMTTLLYSLGEPHIVFADLFSHTQRGNNNAYCQDNEISWIDWDFSDTNKKNFYDFMARTIKASSVIMEEFNAAVNNGLQYDWNCDDWAGENAMLTLTTKNKILKYNIAREGITMSAYDRVFVTSSAGELAAA